MYAKTAAELTSSNTRRRVPRRPVRLVARWEGTTLRWVTIPVG
ncbi:MAG: hypothetical protein S0880_06530 [Actinomycetota bacterium]|nr:hypothetical protein [Actinomycetota bacterium]